MLYTRKTSPKLQQLRQLVSVIDVHNSVALDTYLNVVQGMLDGARVRQSSDLARQYVDLRCYVETSYRILEQHNGCAAKANSKLVLALKREIGQQLEVLEGVSDQIVDQENMERKTNEELFDLFEGGGGRGSGVASVLQLDQCLEILSISEPNPVKAAAPVKVPISFDSLRLPEELNAIIPFAAVGPEPSAPPLPLEPWSMPVQAACPSAPTTTFLPTPPTLPPAPAPAPTQPPLLLAPVVRASMPEKHILSRVIATGAAFNFSLLRPSVSPYTTPFELRIGSTSRHLFYKDDYGVSFMPSLRCCVSPELQVTREALETNRCFFIHLGIATNIHPFALQAAFRHMTNQLLFNPRGRMSIDETSPVMDLVPTLTEYAGFVDANSLNYLWPDEFHLKRICLISNSATTHPMFSCFTTKGIKPHEIEVDVLIHCDGSHFTLLRPMHHRGQSVLSQLVQDAKHSACLVQTFECDNILPRGSTSIASALSAILS